MSKKTTVRRATPAKPAATSHAGNGRETGNGREKTGPAEQAARPAEAHQARITQRAYELYEQRGRQEGLAVEDWLKAERQLTRASGKS